MAKSVVMETQRTWSGVPGGVEGPATSDALLLPPSCMSSHCSCPGVGFGGYMIERVLLSAGSPGAADDDACSSRIC